MSIPVWPLLYSSDTWLNLSFGEPKNLFFSPPAVDRKGKGGVMSDLHFIWNT